MSSNPCDQPSDLRLHVGGSSSRGRKLSVSLAKRKHRGTYHTWTRPCHAVVLDVEQSGSTKNEIHRTWYASFASGMHRWPNVRVGSRWRRCATPESQGPRPRSTNFELVKWVNGYRREKQIWSHRQALSWPSASHAPMRAQRLEWCSARGEVGSCPSRGSSHTLRVIASTPADRDAQDVDHGSLVALRPTGRCRVVGRC